MTRLRAWLRQQAAPLSIALWVAGIVVGVGAIFGGVFMVHPPSAFVVIGVLALGGAVVAVVGE